MEENQSSKQQHKEKATTQVKNKKKTGVIIALIATILVIAILGMTAYSRYRSKIGGKGTAQVAAWSFKVNGSTATIATFDLATTMSNTNGKVVDGLIAPGTSGSFDIEIDGRGSEVAIGYNIEIDISNMPTNLKLYRDENHTKKIEDTNKKATVQGYIELANIDTKVTETIYWNWPYRTGETDEEKLANDRVDTKDAGKETSVSISVTGTQVLEDPTRLKIGDTVKYSTTLNGQTLNNWKVFYVDGDYTYIILDDYLPNAAVDTTNISGLNTYSTYGVYVKYEQNDRIGLLNAMQTKSNWDSLLTGTINGNAVNETRAENVWAMGAPTLDLWVNSWNASYPSDTLYTKTKAMSDGLNGYYVGDSANPNSTSINLSSKTGYNNTLYYPRRGDVGSNECFGYWLASPCASGDEDSLMTVDCSNGRVSNSYYYSYRLALRPVVCLPSNIVNQ